MKIRSGFVSNSSSSSYVVVIEKAAFDEIYEKLNALQKDVVAWLKQDASEFLGKQVVVLDWVSGNYSTIENYTPGDGKTGYKKGDMEYEDDEIGDALYNFKKMVSALPPERARTFHSEF